METKIGCVVMAAGNSRRFGGNKLLTEWQGRPLAAWALDAVPREAETVVVSQYPRILAMAEERGFTPILNPRPEEGLSGTIRLGVEALAHCGGILFLVADQPRLRRDTTEALAALWRQRPEGIAVPVSGGRRGNPCLFPARLYPELLALQGDTGGSRVISRHQDLLLPLEVVAEELWDVDLPADL